jgi:hypothetical protein
MRARIWLEAGADLLSILAASRAFFARRGQSQKTAEAR